MLWFVLVQLLCCYWILKQMEDLKKQQAQLQGMSFWSSELTFRNLSALSQG